MFVALFASGATKSGTWSGGPTVKRRAAVAIGTKKIGENWRRIWTNISYTKPFFSTFHDFSFCLLNLNSVSRSRYLYYYFRPCSLFSSQYEIENMRIYIKILFQSKVYVPVGRYRTVSHEIFLQKNLKKYRYRIFFFTFMRRFRFRPKMIWIRGY